MSQTDAGNTTTTPATLPAKVSLDDVRKRREVVSDKLSTQVRTLGIAIIAFTWGLLVGDSAVAKSLAASFKWEIMAIGGLAILSLLLDFLQYVSGYQNASSLYKKMEGSGDFSYNMQRYCFVAKQAVLFVAAIWLLVRIAFHIYSKA